ncbi:MAG: hypothetical protein EU548_00475 [Promethearchaeota archaeon]|nr:MAG: hypothetical protein EU548_00475 [Candidatus Lokiarchaeota archaeon]
MEYEPLIEIFEQDKILLVIVELPEVSENQMKLITNNDSCKLKVSGPKSFEKTINFPCKVDNKSRETRFKNGILQIVFKKLD